MDDFERKITEAIFLDTLLEIIKSPSFEYIFGFKIEPGSIMLADTTFKRIIERRIDFGIIPKKEKIRRGINICWFTKRW